jgi:hypothetical protein
MRSTAEPFWVVVTTAGATLGANAAWAATSCNFVDMKDSVV